MKVEDNERLKQQFDVCVYGGTASGVLAAVAASRRGCKVLLVEPSRWLGGMIGSGIRITTDCEYPLHAGGLTREMFLRERMFAVWNWNQDGGQLELRQLWQELIQRFEITLLYEYRLQNVVKQQNRIDHLILEYAPPEPDGTPAAHAEKESALRVSARVFIDSSYEGDLLAQAGVDYTVGRESRKEYGESLAGVRNIKKFPGIDPYKKTGDPSSGVLSLIPPEPVGNEGDASRYMIPFNFRYIRAMQAVSGGEAAPSPEDVAPDHRELLLRTHDAGHLGSCKGNFNRRSLFDGSVPGLQADYPDGNWETRARIWRTFIQNDRLVSQISGVKLGLSREMYPDTAGQPHQLYIRMARRMKGRYIMTQPDLMLQTEIDDSIGLGYYNVDIYPCRMVVLEDGTLATEGETWELLSPGPYPISYRALTPREEECSNLLVSVCISASHVACASIRMEPTFMIMGESAGMAAALALEQNAAVQQLDTGLLQNLLLKAGQILDWNGEGYGPVWFNKRFTAWWEKHPEEYEKSPIKSTYEAKR